VSTVALESVNRVNMGGDSSGCFDSDGQDHRDLTILVAEEAVPGTLSRKTGISQKEIGCVVFSLLLCHANFIRGVIFRPLPRVKQTIILIVHRHTE